MSKEETGASNPEGPKAGSEKILTKAADVVDRTFHSTDVLGVVDANNKNLLAVLNDMNKNLVDYISENNKYIFSVIGSSDGNGDENGSKKSLDARVGQIESWIGIAQQPIDDVDAGASGADHSDDDPNAGSGARAAAPGSLGQFVLDAINANNASLMKVLEGNSKALVELIGQTKLDLARELTEREQLQLENLVRRKVSFPFHPIAEDAALPAVVNPMSLTEAMNRLRELAPLNYDNYLTCLDTGTESYSDLPEVSCSTERHPQASLFHDFLQPYLRNVVLDIGCGPQPVPSYLAGWPADKIVGIDPISAPEDHPFQFVSGIGEFLPFPDNSFGTVVSGTTLDHYYLLDLGLKEAFRVLEPGGHFVAWITEFEGAPEYDPYTDLVKPYDHEHMYHIDRKWFLPLMQSMGFEIGEVIRFPLPFNFLFMSFRKPL